MRQRLLALAALVSSVGAGVVIFANWESGSVDVQIERIGSWEMLDRSSVTMAACNNQQCTVAQNILADAGSGCTTRFAEGDFRVSNRMRACFADAGVALSAKGYQRIRLIALRCPAVDGGFSFGVPMSDEGCPVYGVAVVSPLCVRAPLDGGTGCRRRLPDAGTRFFGTGNVMPVDAGVGAQCEPVGCTVFYGDNPDEAL